MKGLRGECLQVSRARGEEFRGFLSMGVLHTYYITYTCLCTHLISMIYVLTGGRVSNTFWLITSLIFNGFSIRKKFWKAETKAYSMAPSDLAYLVVDIVLSWFMSWFKQEMLCQSWW